MSKYAPSDRRWGAVASDVAAIMVRFKQLHSIGVREFGLFLDDIPARLQSDNDVAKFKSIMQAHS